MMRSCSMVWKSSLRPQWTHGHVVPSPKIARSLVLRIRRSRALPRWSPPFRMVASFLFGVSLPPHAALVGSAGEARAGIAPRPLPGPYAVAAFASLAAFVAARFAFAASRFATLASSTACAARTPCVRACPDPLRVSPSRYPSYDFAMDVS